MDVQILSLQDFLPVTVVAAIVIFLSKEIVDYFKKRAERVRKIEAYKTLISEELKKNAWTIKSMREICSSIGDRNFVKLSYAKSSAGSEKLGIWIGSGVEFEALWSIHTSIFDKAVVELAVLDKDLFKEAKATYEHLAEAKHIRDMMINFAEDDAIRGFVKGLTDYGHKNLDSAYEAVEKLYKKCTGKKLSEHKLRSYV